MAKIISRTHPNFERILQLAIDHIQNKGGRFDNLDAFKSEVESIAFVDGRIEINVGMAERVR